MARRPWFSTLRGEHVDLRATTDEGKELERKEILLSGYAPAWSGTGSYFGGYSSVTGVPGRRWGMDRAVKEGFSRDVYVYRAVKTIALDQSRLRFGVRQGDLLSQAVTGLGMAGGPEMSDDPLLPLLNVRANPVELAYQLRERVSMIWMLSSRGGFIEKKTTKGGRPYELWLLPTMRTRVVPASDGTIEKFEVYQQMGRKPRTLTPDKVLWFREPHPDDPYAGLTALEAAGLDIEVDYFARLFNRQFLANDGRPGGIIGLQGPEGSKGEAADEAELERVERKLGGGPVDAGRWVVVDGTVTLVDSSATPRDAQWQAARATSKVNTLGALGVPESVALMNSSERTFSNAGQEWVDYWVHTQTNHSDAFALLWLDTVVGGVPFLDYSHVEALQGPIQARRAEMRDEVNQGMRTGVGYARATGQRVGNGPDDEYPDVPATRALWLAGGKVPIAADPKDQEELEKLVQPAPAAPPAQGQDGGEGTDGGGQGGGPYGPYDPFNEPPGKNGNGYGQAAEDANLKAIASARAAERRRRRNAQLVRAARRGARTAADEEDHRAGALEEALRTALARAANRLVARSLGRVASARVRAGTRHAVGTATKQLDPADVVDAGEWQDQVAAAAAPLVAAAVQDQYDETADGVEEATGHPVAELVGAVAGSLVGAVPVAVPGLTAAQLARLAPEVAEEVAALVGWLTGSAANQAASLAAAVAEADHVDAARGGAPALAPIADAVREWAQGLRSWLDRVAPTSAQQAVEAGKHAVLSRLGDRVERWWRSRRDDKVRDTHKEADGQVQTAGAPFLVGGAVLRYPRDPLGPPGEVINCRCRTVWRVRREQKAPAYDVVTAVLEVKRRQTPHVRTPEGARFYGLPIGAPSAADAHLHAADRLARDARGSGRRDHVAEVVAQRARERPLAPKLARRVAELRAAHGWDPAETRGWPARAVDYYADDGEFMVVDDRGVEHYGAHGAAGALLRNVDEHGTARYLLQKRSGQVQHGGTWSTPGGALHEGEDPHVGAAREVGEELGSDPSKLRHVTTHTADLGGWAYHTVVLDAPDRSAAGDASASGAQDGKSGPGHVKPTERWYDKLVVDTTAPIPARALAMENGYVVQHGWAVRVNGVAYLVETDGAVPHDDPAVTAKLAEAGKVYDAVLGGVPGEHRIRQRGVAMVLGANPSDAYWAKEYGKPGFTSYATGGLGGTTYWAGNKANPGTAAHEFGHNLDSSLWQPGQWVSTSPTPVLPGQEKSWHDALVGDAHTQVGWKDAGFVETRPGGHGITAGAQAPTQYAQSSPEEDFAEAVRLYLKDRREGKLGYVKPAAGQALGTNVRFADLWPERARILDAAFGVQSDYDTAWVQQQRAAAVAWVKKNLEQGVPAESAGADVKALQRRFALSAESAAGVFNEAWDAWKLESAKKDAIEHMQSQWGGLAAPPDDGVQAAMVADLQGLGLSADDAEQVVAEGVTWVEQQIAEQQAFEEAQKAKAAAQAAQQAVVTLADLPADVAKRIRRSRSDVKSRAKAKGATPEEAEQLAAQWEAAAVAKAAKKLGIAGGVGTVVGTTGTVSAAPGAVLPQWLKKAPTAARKFLQAAGTGKHPLSKGAQNAYAYGKAQQAKSNIAAELASRLNNESDWETFRAYRASGAHKGGASYGAADLTLHPDTSVPAWADTTPEERQQMLDDEVNMRVHTWASTSGDDNPYAVMMQRAAAAEFDLPGDWGIRSTKKAEVDKRWPHVQAFYRRFVRVMYEHTQEELAAEGITHVAVYRGMSVGPDKHGWAAHGIHDVPLQPLSSFSVNASTAKSFSGYKMMMRGSVPRERVLGCARTGFGCLNETEYVVMAGDGQWQVLQVGVNVTDGKLQWPDPPPVATAAAHAAVAAAEDNPITAQHPEAAKWLEQAVAAALAGGGDPSTAKWEEELVDRFGLTASAAADLVAELAPETEDVQVAGPSINELADQHPDAVYYLKEVLGGVDVIGIETVATLGDYIADVYGFGDDNEENDGVYSFVEQVAEALGVALVPGED